MNASSPILVIRNNTAYTIQADIGNPAANTNVNQFTAYSYDVTDDTFENATQVTIQVKGNSTQAFQTYTVPLAVASPQGVADALNTLGFGYFSVYTAGGTTSIIVSNDTLIYGTLDIDSDPYFDLKFGATVVNGDSITLDILFDTSSQMFVNWGDGTTDEYNALNPNPSHTYTVAGSYDILVVFTTPTDINYIHCIAAPQVTSFVINPDVDWSAVNEIGITGTSITEVDTSTLSGFTSMTNMNFQQEFLTEFDLAPLPDGILFFNLTDNLLTELDPSLLPATVTNLLLDENSFTSFDVSQIPTPCTQISLANNDIETLVNPSGIPAVALDVTLGGNRLPTSEINALLIALDNNGLDNGSVDTSGQTPAAPPSGAGATAKTNLEGKGWFVTTD